MTPLYEYRCEDCGNLFEELVRHVDDHPTNCRICASPEIKRAVTAHGGYSMDSGPSSTTPKGSGSFK